jgi:hypothetical protein
MNLDDTIRALEAKRAEIDAAIRSLQGARVLLQEPIPKHRIMLPAAKNHTGHNGGRKAPVELYARILAFVAAASEPVALAEILAAVSGSRRHHVKALQDQGQIVGEGVTIDRRYHATTKALESIVVWNNRDMAAPLSSHLQRPRG